MTVPPPAALARVDKVGAASSTLCAVHCATTAAIPSALAALGIGALTGPAFEWGFTAIAVVLATAALVLSWKRHPVRWIGAVFVMGILGLVGSRLLETAGVHGLGPALGVVSGIALAVAHIASIRANRRRSNG